MGTRDGDMTQDDFGRHLGLEFERLVSDGHVNVDADAIAASGAERLRRRRNLTAVGVAVGVMILVAGGTLIGRPGALSDSAGSPGSVPVCATATVRPLATQIPDRFDSSAVTPSPAATWSAQSSRPTTGRATHAAEDSPNLVASGQASSPLTTTFEMPDAPAWFTPEKNRQLNRVATSALPAAVRAAGLTFRNVVGVSWSFYGSSEPTWKTTDAGPVVSAETTLESGNAFATLTVTLREGPLQRPECSAGLIRSRTIRSDGMVVDVGPVTASSVGWTAYTPMEGDVPLSPIPPSPLKATKMNGSANTDSIQVVAYRPDGSVVTVILTDALGHVVTEAQLVDLATAPGLDVTTPPK